LIKIKKREQLPIENHLALFFFNPLHHTKESPMNAHDMKAIAALDLEPIKVKLMHAESGEGWSQGRADAIEFEYRRFLFLMQQFPNEETAPLVDVDTFWHYHILDTMKYAADCEAAFGYFLHHYPYVGMRGADDAGAQLQAGLRMKQLYEATFGDAHVRSVDDAAMAYCGVPDASAASGAAGKTAYCGVPVKTAYCGVPVKTAYCGATGNAATQASTVIDNARQSSAYGAHTGFSPAR
jgi:hypothetical protein